MVGSKEGCCLEAIQHRLQFLFVEKNHLLIRLFNRQIFALLSALATNRGVPTSSAFDHLRNNANAASTFDGTNKQHLEHCLVHLIQLKLLLGTQVLPVRFSQIWFSSSTERQTPEHD